MTSANISSIRFSQSRLTGLDLARGLAVVGMVLVNCVYVFSYSLVGALESDPSSSVTVSPLGQVIAVAVLIGLAGRAAAVFLVLFGMGISLKTRRTGILFDSGWAWPQVRRYLLLMLGGLVFIPLWEADILHYIGLYGLLVLPLLKLRTRWLILIGIGVLLSAEIWRAVFDYQNGWQVGAVGSHYEDMWSLIGQLRQLFCNGYHPVFPWLGLVIFGLCLGRLDLRNQQVLRRLVLAGVLAAGAGFTAQALGVPAGFFPADTLFILLGMANATWIIALCLWICRDVVPPSRGGTLNRMTRNMGRLALSHYPGHVLLAIVPVLVLRHERTDLSFEASFSVAIAYLVVTGIGGHLWLKNHRQGPLEKTLRHLVDNSKPVGNRPTNGI